MALKKPKKDEMEVEDTKWAEDVVKEYGKYIPQIVGIPKSSATCNLHFRIASDIADLGASIAFKKSAQFKTPSEVYRAAMYIGTMILYTMYKDKHDDSRGDVLYHILMESEVLRIGNDKIDRLITYASELKRAVINNIITWEECYSKIEEQLTLFPVNLRSAATKSITKVMNGNNINDLMSYKTVGRQRKNEQFD